MQITEFEVRGLFGRVDHRILFPPVEQGDPSASVTILYGINGVGKTTVLKMLDGLLRDERPRAFDIFRKVPFTSCRISISDVAPLTICPDTEDGMSVLRVEFDGETVTIGGDVGKRNAPTEEEDRRSKALLDRFQGARSDVSFQFLQTARLENVEVTEELGSSEIEAGAVLYTNRVARILHERDTLSARMKRFIADAQLDYRTFFISAGTDVFARIIERLTAPTLTAYSEEELIDRLGRIREQEEAAARFGLEREEWDYEQLVDILRDLPAGDAGERTLAVIAQYVEMLEARAVRRSLVADRLSTFEAVMDDFFVGKRVTVTAREGLHIETDGEEPMILSEQQLSSGERHLLYLMASAVMTRRKGTIIAIDEPEMSMHVAWQRKLIPGLLKCAARAEPQFIFATHSPEVIANYQDRLVELRAS